MQTIEPSPKTDIAAFMRTPSQVMRLARMGSAHPTRLSFLRVLMRRAQHEGWCFDRPLWEIDARGVGRAVYRAIGPQRTYCLVAFAHDLPPEMRSDRVIATAWDATFTLFDGEPDAADLDRLQQNVPLQEAGRISVRELTLSRANRSVRLFAHVVGCLAEGRQPDPAEIDAVGYLMRTTAVYGSGKFGAADRDLIADRAEFAAPFQAEMLNVWLTRCFTIDIAEHLARVQGGDRAAPLAPELRLRLGVGNSTGLGMAPFMIRHPILLNNWMMARETALARVRALPQAAPKQVAELREALARARVNAASWHSAHPLQVCKLDDLRTDLARIGDWLMSFPTCDPHPWDALWRQAEAELSLEGQEVMVSLLLEPHGDLVDDLADTMSAAGRSLPPIDGTVCIDQMRALLAQHYDWALALDFSDPHNVARFWYVSEEKLEPRIGDRCADPGAELEQPLCIARMAVELDRALAAQPAEGTLAAFLLAHPEHRVMARRVQIAAQYPYSEIQDNLIGDGLLPIDMMRCKLAFFGASHFDPRSDKWVRISLFQNEPFPPGLMEPARAAVSASHVIPEASQGTARCLSRNETETLVAKAGRGAGLSWGLADEAGYCAGWLARQGVDGAAWVLAHLIRIDDLGHAAMRPVQTAAGWRAHGSAPICPVWLGAALLDQGTGGLSGVIRADRVARPVLLLPFLALLARESGPLSVQFGAQSVVLDLQGAVPEVAALAVLDMADVTISLLAADRSSVRAGAFKPASGNASPAPSTGRALPMVAAATISALNALALRTTVPATVASRRGAGAAGDDND